MKDINGFQQDTVMMTAALINAINTEEYVIVVPEGVCVGVTCRLLIHVH